MPADLRPEIIAAALRGRWGHPLRSFDVVGSTNEVAFEWATSGAPEGAVVIADHQTEGRGRWGRTWVDPPGALLMFSLVLRPAVDLARLTLLSTAAGVACAEAIEELTGLEAGLKWPNDVMVGGQKLAGTLVEGRGSSSGPSVVVVGCGLNVDWPEAAMPMELAGRATSLSARLGPGVPPPPRAALLAAILAAFERLYPLIADPLGSEELARAAGARSCLLGKQITVAFPDGTTLTGTAKHLLPSGALEVEVAGEARAIHAAEVRQVRS